MARAPETRRDCRSSNRLGHVGLCTERDTHAHPDHKCPTGIIALAIPIWLVGRADRGLARPKGRNGRPAFDALCRDATKRQFDVVMAWNVDRLGRSLKDLVAFLSELHALGIDLFLHQQGLDTTTPAGKAMFQMLGVFAEFERSIIQERVRAGLQRAKREGKRLGRPPIADKLAERIRAALAGGMSVRKTAAKFDVNPSTVQRVARPFDDAEHASVAAGASAHRTLGMAGSAQADLLHCKHIAHPATPTPGGTFGF
jgi:DNA invertase Pin-like site-specific DNA recombinase